MVRESLEGSKRTLRSSEMLLPPSGLLDTETELNFSLQYPHFLKRDGNKLHVMLQRRKRYKNRTILGYKTLAQGIINMSQVLQHQMDLELDLICESKELKAHAGTVIAKVLIQSLVSQPIDQDLSFCKQNGFSDDEEEFSSGDENENEGSDSDPNLNLENRGSTRKSSKLPNNARQRNLKQKFIALLKRFRVNEDYFSPCFSDDEEEFSSGDENENEGSDSDPNLNLENRGSTRKSSKLPNNARQRNLKQKFIALLKRFRVNEYKNRTILGYKTLAQGIINMSQGSKRTLRSSEMLLPPSGLLDTETELNFSLQLQRCLALVVSRNIGYSEDLMLNFLFRLVSEKPTERLSDESSKKADSDSHPDSDPPPPPLNSSPPKCHAVDSSDSIKKCNSSFIRCKTNNTFVTERGWGYATKIVGFQRNLIIQSCFSLSCNTNPKPPTQIKIILIGTDSFYNSVLRHYVDQLSYKPPDWQTYIKFYMVPIFTSSSLCRYLGSLDATYNSMFLSDSWKESLDRASLDATEAVTRILHYVSIASTPVLLPVAEAMLTYKEKSSDDESSQIFIPFINEVRLGTPLLYEVTGPPDPPLDTGGTVNKETDLLPASPTSNNNNVSNKETERGPPSLSLSLQGEKISPPSSPNMNVSAPPTSSLLGKER
ncbi:phosphofurin acidic cluster sorting protein 1 [Diaphorina citri]|uniref:Phosphofurin acidic cluster sorting protein 1 n=1 Tax=Diaphorina citri TaxID=121845 RepID=A0A3Q0JPI2_DIACI|nr:phosphofurin acidic cluster sorting protein 1 [Diaphorina citri]